MSIDKTYTAKEIAGIMGQHKTTILRRVKKESWPGVNGNGKGGDHRKYPLAALPADVQLAIYNKEGAPTSMLPVLSPSALATIAENSAPIKTFAEIMPSTDRRRDAAGTGNPSANPPAVPTCIGTMTHTMNRRGAIPENPSSRENLPAVPTLYNNDVPEAAEFRFLSPLSSMPSPSLAALTPATAMSLDALKNDRIRTILGILREADAIPRDWQTGKRKWIEFVAAKHKIRWQTIYRWQDKHAKRGIAGLEHRKSNREQPKSWTAEALDFWISLTLKPANRKMDLRAMYEDALVIEAHRRGWAIGGLESARWWYEKKATPALLAMQRGGMRALDNIMPPVLRDYSDLAPFEMLVGDQHRWDFWVVDDDTGVVFRPEAYIWQDLRTRIIYGAAFDRRYDAHLCGLALLVGMRIWGCFNAIYTDNGSSELSKYMIGILSEIRSLGMDWQMTVDTPLDLLDVDGEDINPMIAPGTHKKAIVKNAKAKMIEKTNDVLEGLLRGRFRLPGSVKRLSDDTHTQDVDQNEARQLAADGKLPLASEFYLTVYKAIDYYNREKAHRGLRREWAWRPVPPEPRPMDCLMACYRDGWRPRMISDEAAGMLFMRRVSRVVRLGRVELNRELYEHDALLELHDERVDVRHNPIESDLVLVYRGGQFLCAAHPVEYSSMKDDDLARRKIMEKRSKRKAIADRFRAMTQFAPDLREYSQVPAEEKVAAQVGQEKKRIETAQANAARALSPEDLAVKVAELEALNARLPDGRTQAMAMAQIGKPLPARPDYFATAMDRYFWCIKCEASGGELSAEDRYFVEEEELKMTPGERDRWRFEREYGT